jgi:hypothetical protein
MTTPAAPNMGFRCIGLLWSERAYLIEELQNISSE